MIDAVLTEGLTFDDVLLEPARSEVLPSEVDTRTCLTRQIGLNIPIVYANDTVFAYHVAKLAASLVDWLVAPVSFGTSWSKFGIQKSRIIHYD